MHRHRGRQAGLLLEDRIQESDQALSAEMNYKPVEDGGQLSLGREPCLHGNENASAGLKACLLCQRGTNPLYQRCFRQHYRDPAFDDQIGDAIMPHAKKYFANILPALFSSDPKLMPKGSIHGLAIDMILQITRDVGERIPRRL